MNKNIERFEHELSNIQRPGIDKLLNYIKKSDFYTAPSSTKYHLACEGGLLQHSLNVMDALRGLLVNDGQYWLYQVAGQTVVRISDESVVIVALLHDICKANYYSVSLRNAKNEETGKWEKVPYYTVDDKMPLGHGSKSAMIIKQYMDLTTSEMYAIWWHMGAYDAQADLRTLNQAIDKYPLILALHTADMMASNFMEDMADNKVQFIPATGSDEGQAGQLASESVTESGFVFEEVANI